MVLGGFKVFSGGSGGGEAGGMIFTEKSVTGEETEDCVIVAEVTAAGSEKYYASLLCYIVCVYIFSIIHDSQRKSGLLDEQTIWSKKF